MISRRQLLILSALLSLLPPTKALESFAFAERRRDAERYPTTIAILKEAYWAEFIAHKHYNAYCTRALADKYPNIGYLFWALSLSEKIHADNYQQLLVSLGADIAGKDTPVTVATTRKNLNTAAINELEKINKFYPDIFQRLSLEAHDQTVLNCMYSWKSHQQHRRIISDIKRYSGIFFRPLARKIENMNPNYYVCEICGSTIEKKPEFPCEICNYPMYHYKKLDRPAFEAG